MSAPMAPSRERCVASGSLLGCRLKKLKAKATAIWRCPVCKDVGVSRADIGLADGEKLDNRQRCSLRYACRLHHTKVHPKAAWKTIKGCIEGGMRHKSENLEKAWAHTQHTAALRRYVKLTSADSQHKEVVTVKWPIPSREGVHRTRLVCKQCRGMTMSPQRMLLRKCEPSRQVRGWYTKRSNLIKALRELSATEEVNNLIKLVDPDQQVPSSYTFWNLTTAQSSGDGASTRKRAPPTTRS